MESTKFSFSFHDLLTSPQKIEETMGYKPGEAPEPVTIILDEVINEISGLNEARAEYEILKDIKFDPTEKSLIIENISFDIKSIIFSQIKKADEVALFICTAGKIIGEKSRISMKSDDLLRGYIYDVVGTEIVEAAADRMQEELRKSMAAPGKEITNRFSPGYCGWDVAEQHKLFGFFKDNFCGITLTESALMNPIKSVSGVIGIGRNVRFTPYQCKLCDDKNCIYRSRKSKV